MSSSFSTFRRGPLALPAAILTVICAGSMALLAEEPRVIVIKANAFSFDPSHIEVTTGERVRLVLRNTGTRRHCLAIPKLNQKTRAIGPGQQAVIELKVDEPGAHEFLCEQPGHAPKGMKGTLLVSAPREFKASSNQK